MRWLIRLNDPECRRLMRAHGGRIPLAWLTFGGVSGHGWGFLGPWAQVALFPAKGTPAGRGAPERDHVPFVILRLMPKRARLRHRLHSWAIEGRYWWALVWRRGWYRRVWRWHVPAPRWAIVDPDIVIDDPGRADDWGSRPGENW